MNSFILRSKNDWSAMKKLVIEKTVKTPFISADPTGEIKIEGISVPENAIDFFEDLRVWIEEYNKNPAKTTVCSFKFDYFNTSTAGIVLSFLKILNKMHNSGNSITINWYYDSNDFEIQESGNEFKSLISAPFHVIQTSI